MSRLIPPGDMTADQIIDTSYDLMALLTVAEAVARVIHDGPESPMAGALARILALASELYAPLHDTLEGHEGLKGGAK